MAKILEGKTLNKKILDGLSSKISLLKEKPALAIIQVGDRPDSDLYITKKAKFGQKLGVEVKHLKFPENVSSNELENKIKDLNGNLKVTGVIIQLPLPKSLNVSDLIEHLDWRKDVDGFHSKNLKNLASGRQGIIPATVKGILKLLEYHQISVNGKKIVIINRSMLVGKPLALALLNKDATVSICHSKTQNIEEEIGTADIIVSAVGKPKVFSPELFKPHQVIIDVGISVEGKGVVEEFEGEKVSGDMDFEALKDKVTAISPVPGGVGPLTVACLFENLFEVFKLQNS